MNEGASDPDKKKKFVKKDVLAKVPAKQDIVEQGIKKRKCGHMKMIARKRKRPQPDVDSDKTTESVSSPEGDYLVVYRVNGNFRAFNYLIEILHIFDRQDMFHLYNLVMKQYSESTPEDWEIITWRLYEAYGVCILEFKDGTVIHMLVEIKYPLSKELRQRMLDFGLEVEVESLAALDLENGLQFFSRLTKTIELGNHKGALRTTPKGGVLLGPERPRTYEDLSDTEKKRYDADVRATNIVLQGLPKDIYKSSITH
ncbi:hypothetical protein Tco_1408244 [Tanacetum coccineum]